jgi:hypothetical protein
MKNMPLKVTLFSANGITVKEFTFNGGENRFSINISDLASGLYFLMFTGKDIYSAGKLVVH